MVESRQKSIAQGAKSLLGNSIFFEFGWGGRARRSGGLWLSLGPFAFPSLQESLSKLVVRRRRGRFLLRAPRRGRRRRGAQLAAWGTLAALANGQARLDRDEARNSCWIFCFDIFCPQCGRVIVTIFRYFSFCSFFSAGGLVVALLLGPAVPCQMQVLSSADHGHRQLHQGPLCKCGAWLHASQISFSYDPWGCRQLGWVTTWLQSIWLVSPPQSAAEKNLKFFSAIGGII